MFDRKSIFILRS